MIIGLTGPSGSGKTTLSKAFEKDGFLVLDCDKIVHQEVYRDSLVLKAIADAFGEDCIEEGALNRAVLRGKTMGNPAETKRLNETVLPLIVAHIERILDQNKERNILLDAPTLFESGLQSQCHKVIAMGAPKELSIRRIMARDHLSGEDAERRLQSQKSPEYYRERSDYFILNDGTEQELYQKVSALLDELHETENL